MFVLYPNDPRNAREPDADYADEARSALAAGFQIGVIDHDSLCCGEIERALRFCGQHAAPCVYRGWMMTARQYKAFHAALTQRGYEPLTNPEQYAFSHHLPENFPSIEKASPATVWITSQDAGLPHQPDWSAIIKTAARLGPGPCIVKDWVKSQKHAWSTACFIPNAQDEGAVQRIAGRFVELQGDQLCGGLVFRKLTPLHIIGHHPRSGMPLGAEVRSFWVGGQPKTIFPYWDEIGFDEKPPMETFQDIGKSLRSPFFTVDIAKAADGRWIIMELGDGQVAGLPNASLAPALYAALAAKMRTP